VQQRKIWSPKLLQHVPGQATHATQQAPKFPVTTLEKIVQSLTAQHIIEDRPKSVISIPENVKVFDALKKMNEHDIGCIIVNRFAGGFSIFTETDYVRKIAIRGLSSKTTELNQVANPNVVTVQPHTTIDKMSSLMMTEGIHHLPVVEYSGEPNSQTIKPIGVISSRDIACNFVEAVDAATDIQLEGTFQQVFERLGRREPQDIWVQEDDTVYDALMKMANKRVGALLVHSGTAFAGIFTERDYLNRIILKGRSSRQTKVKEVMSPDVQYIHMETNIRECLDIAIHKRFRHIPIVSLIGKEINDRDLVGMLTINDIVSFLMFELELRRLKQVSPDLH